MKRKVVSLMLVSAMVAGMLAGCGSDSGSSKGGSSTETGSAAEASSSGETADDADDKSPITFEYFNADGKNGNWDNPVAKAITEATGVTLDVSYPVASQGDAKEDVALMIANDEYPDMIYAKGSATDLYQAGALIDMTDLIEKYGPNIKKMYGAEMEKLKWSQDDPGIYQLSYAGVNQKTLTTGFCYTVCILFFVNIYHMCFACFIKMCKFFLIHFYPRYYYHSFEKSVTDRAVCINNSIC